MLVAHSQAPRALPKTSSEVPSLCVCVCVGGGGGGRKVGAKVHRAHNIMLILALHQLRMLVGHSQV
jgi:hypothetical protein